MRALKTLLNFSCQYSRIVKFTILLLLPGLAWAHPSPLSGQGFVQGLIHPLTGLDHSLAMLSVGLLASRNNKTPAWLFPACFLGFMLFGGLVGFSGIALPWIEFGILLSVFSLGILISFTTQFPKLIIFLLIFIFALCHGHAHGHEMAPAFNASLYASGFLLATASLHFLGFVLGYCLKKQPKWIFSLTGFTIALSSLWL